MSGEVRMRDSGKRTVDEKSRSPRNQDDSGGGRASRLIEVMRRITEEIREEVVQTIRDSKNNSF